RAVKTLRGSSRPDAFSQVYSPVRSLPLNSLIASPFGATARPPSPAGARAARPTARAATAPRQHDGMGIPPWGRAGETALAERPVRGASRLEPGDHRLQELARPPGQAVDR